MARCKICSKMMTKNMSRHLRTKHPKIFREVAVHLDKSVNQRPRKNSTSWLKGSWVRKYCERISDTNKYRCNMCHAVLSLVHGFLGNMKRHIKTKHPIIYEKEVGCGSSEAEIEIEKDDNDEGDYVIEYEFNEDDVIDPEAEISEAGSDEETGNSVPFLHEDDPEFEEKVRSLCLKKIDKVRAKSYFWNFYSVVEEDRRYACLACKRRVNIFPKSVANLKRHIKTRHKELFDLITKFLVELNSGGNESPVSFDKHYFDLEGEGEYKCKECGDVISSQDEDQHILFDHIKDNHPDQILAYQEETVVHVDEAEYSDIVIVKSDSLQDEV